jgi:hypothetical protein
VEQISGLPVAARLESSAWLVKSAEALHPPAVELVEACFIPRGAEGHQTIVGSVVKAAEQFVVAELKPLEQIQGVLGAKIGCHVVAVPRIAVQPAHVPHLELGAVRPCGVGRID